MTNLKDELSMDQLDIACGGKDGDGNGTGTGKGDGLGWLRRLGGEIVGAVKSIFGL
ncbi:MAG: hypothetical protein J0H42_07745 [Rhizobiales bacterium]|jgi:hypothetical protein|nr:hypothetical protein [Hyphomicrobiales bacterium]